MDPYAAEFPILNEANYLDHASVNPIPLRSRVAGRRFIEELHTGALLHVESWAASRMRVKELAARMLRCAPEEIALLRSTSEGLNLVADHFPWNPGDNVILFSHEFPANLYPWTNQAHRGVEARYVPEREGGFLLEDVEALMDERTRIVAVSFVEYSTGFKNDLKALGELCRKNGSLLVVDGVQGLGVLPVDVKEWGVHFFSSGVHKWLMGGFGVGIFFADASVMDLLEFRPTYSGVEDPFLYTVADQKPASTADRFECGVPDFTSLPVVEGSLELLMEVGMEEIRDRIFALTDRLIEGLHGRGYRTLGPVERRHRSGIVSFRSSRHSSEELFKLFLENKVIVSHRRDAIRVSPHFYNRPEQIDFLLSLLPPLD